MGEAARHAALLAASLVLLIAGLAEPVYRYVCVLAALGLLVLSNPRFNYRYPKSYSYYEHVFRRYIVRFLAATYVSIFFIIYPGLESLALLVFTVTYSVASFLVGVEGVVAAFLSLIGIGGAVLLTSRSPLTFHSLGDVALFTSILLMFVIAPWFMAAYYVASKYYEKLYEYGRVPSRRLPLDLGVSAALLLFLLGALVGELFAATTKEYFFIVPGVLTGLLIGALIYGISRRLRGEIWIYTSYTDDFVDTAAYLLEEMLRERGWSYEAKGVFGRRGVRVNIYSPFRARITVREWVHRAYVYTGGTRVSVTTGSGTIIEVSPGPAKASRPMKEFMRSFLSALRLEKEADEWA